MKSEGSNMSEALIMESIHQKLGDRVQDFLLPPPVFKTMGGEFVEFDADCGIIKTRFPVMEKFLNPYGSMQGGMVAAAVDNTFGPLSMLVAPPNVTRRLEMKYSRPATTDLKYIEVEARFKKREGRWLTLTAEVRDQRCELLARAKATHWILEEDGS
jgi:acyl-coenzyme A thioesterase PaaI-like protein